MTIASDHAPFSQVFDAIVVGSGHAGYAATMALRRRGRSVLLVGSRGDLVWESGRAFCPDAGTCDDIEWRNLVAAVAQRGGVAGGWMDGAVTEVVATDQLLASGATVLYYAQPVAVECDGDVLASLIVATKLGLRRLAGRRWIDATESGELLRLIEPALAPRPPEHTHVYMMLQHSDWSKVSATPVLRPTVWQTERVLGIEVQHCDSAWRGTILAGLTELGSVIGADIANVSMSHLSIEPVSQYTAAVAGTPVNSVNVVSAAPGFAAAAVTTLADRFMLGADAAAALDGRDIRNVGPDVLLRRVPRVEATRTLRVDVCVAGAGTGGALAALAAATAGASVACVEPLAFVGGIGTGGGIHTYFYGAPGGLQREVDQRTRELMNRFHRGPLGDGPFNPWAKMIALEQMLREHGVDIHAGALFFDVEKRDGGLTAAMAATPHGVLRIEASAFIDGTGDGDLCAMAGAEYAYGREYDGMLHAYSQSSGILREVHGRPRMGVVNFDAGFCDPADPSDITRARLTGVRQYLLDSYNNSTRPTYIAPALGLRQARQIVTDYTLTLDDLISRRRFDDRIGYTGAIYDNHGTDFEFESDESMFWTWACRQFLTPISCEMSYRMLLPRGLSNVWIASRCLGVSQDAHNTARMQRDMQRVGEVAGFAAAEAVSRGETSRQLAYAALRKWLDKTGALEKEPRNLNSDFGEVALLAMPDELPSAAKALAELDRGQPGQAMWWLYRHEELIRDAVIERLGLEVATQPMVAWLAASLLAMWSDPIAEPRLIKAIQSREYGFGEGYPLDRWKDTSLEPLVWSKVVPNWLCAVALLRRSGTKACLPALDQLIDHPTHGINTLTTIALTLERLVERGLATSDDLRRRIEAMLDRILNIRVVGAFDYAGRHVGRHSECAIRGQTSTDDPGDIAPVAPGLTVRAQLPHTYVDATWQLHLSVACARLALGVPIHQAAKRYLRDERAYVRHAFQKRGISTT